MKRKSIETTEDSKAKKPFLSKKEIGTGFALALGWTGVVAATVAAPVSLPATLAVTTFLGLGGYSALKKGYNTLSNWNAGVVSAAPINSENEELLQSEESNLPSQAQKLDTLNPFAEHMKASSDVKEEATLPKPTEPLILSGASNVPYSIEESVSFEPLLDHSEPSKRPAACVKL